MEPTVEDLLKENEDLKKRVKRLEKRVAKLKKRHETVVEELLEMDNELASDVPVYEKKIEGKCPKCGSKMEKLEIPGKVLSLCTRCQHRSVE